jgi:hypothetical protein
VRVVFVEVFCNYWRRRWEDNIKMGFTDTDWEVVDWKILGQDRDEWWALVWGGVASLNLCTRFNPTLSSPVLELFALSAVSFHTQFRFVWG